MIIEPADSYIQTAGVLERFADEFTSISNIVGAGLVPARFCSTGGQGQALPLLSSLTWLIHTKTAL
ncbi:MAG TPA: hypothetical protein VF708_01235, partial [Pyrinomonadaceae bacterium]